MQCPQLSAGFTSITSFATECTKDHSLQKRTCTEIKRFSNPLDRFKAKPTRKHAIYAHCYRCVGSGADSTWKTEIGNCQITDCALWMFRPYQQRYKGE